MPLQAGDKAMKAKKLFGSATPTQGQSAQTGGETNHGLEDRVERKQEIADTIIGKHKARALALNAEVRKAGKAVSKLAGDVMRDLSVTSTLNERQLVGAVIAISQLMDDPIKRAEWYETGSAYLGEHDEVSPLLYFRFDVLTLSLEKKLRDLGMKRSAGAKYFTGKCDEELVIALAIETGCSVWVLDEEADKVWKVKSGIPQARQLTSSENIESGVNAMVVGGASVHPEDSSATQITVEIPMPLKAARGYGGLVGAQTGITAKS
jgi:hypothetical protein